MTTKTAEKLDFLTAVHSTQGHVKKVSHKSPEKMTFEIDSHLSHRIHEMLGNKTLHLHSEEELVGAALTLFEQLLTHVHHGGHITLEHNHI